MAVTATRKVDELTGKILSENDPATRLDLVTQAYQMTTDEVAYIPMHQQGLAWGVSTNVDLAQRADNEFMMYYVNKK